MEYLQTLTIAYECESALGNSLNIKKMTKEFLRIFLKKTSAIYAIINNLSDNKYSIFNSVGKNYFYDLVIDAKPEKIDKFSIVNITQDKVIYRILYISLKNHYLAFVYSEKNNIDIKIVANIFYSLRKKIELGIKACLEHERLELALLGNKAGIWDWNLLNNNIYFSPGWKEILGYSDDEITNEFSTWKSRVHPDDLKETYKAIYENIDGKTKYYEGIYRLKHKDGSWVWILDRGKTIFDENDKAIRMIGTHIDITTDKKLQLKYTQQAEVMKQINDSVISTDLEGNIVSWNNGAEKMLGYKAQEVIGKHMSIIHRKEDIEQNKAYALELSKGKPFSVESYLVSKSKELIHAMISLSILKDENNTPIGLIGVSQDISERKRTEKELLEQKDKLTYLAHHDTLTGLPNRFLFNDRLKQSIEICKRNNTKVALLFIDLDHFKEINDSLGHDVGDEILKIVTSRLSNIIRNEDTLARLGGDEFTVIMNNLHHEQNASVVAQKIIEVLATPINIEDNDLYVSSSIGISLYPNDDDSPQNLLKYADSAMYKAKAEGRNNFQFYSSDMTELALERVQMESALREALKNEEFVVYYQPQINAKTDSLIGMEALVRWEHPTMGIISPAKFIHIAEATGLIVELDRLVMKIAMKQIAQWYKNGFNPGILAMNLSVKQLQKKDFVDIFKSLIHETKCKPQWLELEITEGQIMHNPEEAIKILKNLSEIGIELAIDDFGTGYSSLAYLKKLPIDKLKIDQEFVRGLPNDDEDAGITKAVIALAKSLNLKIIAEGVETKEQRDFMIENGCENIQGYFYSKPITTDKLTELLISNKWN